MIERWKPVVGFKGFYEVSDYGRVKSVKRKVKTWFGKRTNNGRMLVPIVHPTHKYFLVSLGNPPKQKRIHRLVLEAFVGFCPKGNIARHLDGNKANNSLKNLCWGTHVENESDKRIHGTVMVGEKNPLAKLTKKQVIYIRKSKRSNPDLASQFDVTHSLISKIRLRRHWVHI